MRLPVMDKVEFILFSSIALKSRAKLFLTAALYTQSLHALQLQVKFLVPRDISLAQLAVIVRNRLSISQTETFFLFSSATGAIPPMTITLSELYTCSRDSDGFLYLSYASQEVFG